MREERETVLFVCSGNFYRSRFAEALFNHQALMLRLGWRAESRGFSPHLATEDLSHYTRAALELRNIPLALTRRKPARLEAGDLDRASLVICVKEAEHRPLMVERFPDWADHVVFWQIHDIDVEPPGTALITLEQNVLELIDRLQCPRRAAMTAPPRALALEF
jgi:protein-tyrosine phosphatase